MSEGNAPINPEIHATSSKLFDMALEDFNRAKAALPEAEADGFTDAQEVLCMLFNSISIAASRVDTSLTVLSVQQAMRAAIDDLVNTPSIN